MRRPHFRLRQLLNRDYIVLYRDTSNEYRWTLYAGNHERLAVSSEGYPQRADCIYGMERTFDGIYMPLANKLETPSRTMRVIVPGSKRLPLGAVLDERIPSRREAQS